MTQEDKELLFKDLCARLPYYGLMVQYKGEDFNIIDIGFGRVTLVKPFMSTTSGSPLIEEVKPYLRPMSSMTEEEIKEFTSITENVLVIGKKYTAILSIDSINWLNAHHFDYRGLIEKGLAIAVTKENNPYKK